METQHDHFVRLADLCFRHLRGAYEQYSIKQRYEWISEVSNDDPRFGRQDFLESLGKREFYKSEEYSQSIAATLFAHFYLLSAANYYRLEYKGTDKEINRTDSPQKIAKILQMDAEIIQHAEELHEMRNAIAHLVATKEEYEKAINNLEWSAAHKLVKTSYTIYLQLLRHYLEVEPPQTWELIAVKYEFPAVLD